MSEKKDRTPPTLFSNSDIGAALYKWATSDKSVKVVTRREEKGLVKILLEDEHKRRYGVTVKRIAPKEADAL
tara:strand:+ start:800 stop:1015 length:216 start_codon:yes stop_codon:yes gene_type:complete